MVHQTTKVTNVIPRTLFLSSYFPVLLWLFKNTRAGFWFTDWSLVLMIISKIRENQFHRNLHRQICDLVPMRAGSDPGQDGWQAGQLHALRSDIFWTTCCTMSRPWAHLTVSSKCTFSGTQYASFLSSVNWQTAKTLETPTINRRRSLRRKEKNTEQMDRLVLDAGSDLVFLPVERKESVTTSQ